MNRQTSYLVFLIAILVGIGVYRFKDDLFGPKKIQIFYRNFPARSGGAEKFSLSFYLDKPYQLRSIKVVSVKDAETNKYPHALWHLVAQTNSVPTEQFKYGGHIVGMKSDMPHAAPESLEPGQKYKLIVETDTKVR